MLLHRGGVRVDLNDRYFGAVVVDVLVERDQLGLVLLDELDEAGPPPAFGIQLAWLETVGGNEDQRCAGRSWCDGWGAGRDVWDCLSSRLTSSASVESVRSFQRSSEAIFASSAARAMVNASEPSSRRSGGSSTWVICRMACAVLNGSLRGVPDVKDSAISPTVGR